MASSVIDFRKPQKRTASSSSDTPDARPLIRCEPGRLPWMADQAETVLLANEAIYQRGGVLVRAVRKPAETVRGVSRAENSLVLVVIESDYLLERLNRLARFERWDKRDKTWVSCDCPTKIAKTLLARRGVWRFRPLSGIISAPTLRPDGSILEKPGYDEVTGLLFNASEFFPPIPNVPTRDEALQALATLADVIKDFPFREPHDKSVVLAAILTALVRRSLKSAPMFPLSAPKMASGKSLLADVVALIATGTTTTVMSYTADADEMRKRILSVLIQGDEIINVDNIESGLKSDVLCSVLTQDSYTDRLLGQNRTATLPTSITWMATGNNLMIEGDMTTRVLPCHLDPQCERPEEREFDRNLYEWIPEHRARLVVAGLTVLRAYVVAGQPKQPVKTFGRFEAWSDLVRSALLWLGEPDPLLSRAYVEDADPVRNKLRSLLLAWYTTFRTAEATSREAALRANTILKDEDGSEYRPAQALFEVLEEHFADSKGVINTKSLGRFIDRYSLRVEAGARFEDAGSSSDRKLWRVRVIDEVRLNTLLKKFSSTNQTVETVDTVKTDDAKPERFERFERFISSYSKKRCKDTVSLQPAVRSS